VAHDGTIRYGVTNIRSGKWNGTWFSATDFKLEKTGDLPKRHKPLTPHKSTRRS
jgi:hypothetical protein